MTTTDAPTGVRRFPCQQCGARLEYAPGTDALVCPYCGYENHITTAASPAAAGVTDGVPPADALELDLNSALAALHEGSDRFTAMAVTCTACNAEVRAPEGQSAFPCPFCGSNIVATAHASTQIKPNAVLPFKIPRDRAIAAFRQWLGSRWFAPSALKSEGRLDAAMNGVYLPAWTYDADTTTWYDGERGDAYYVTVTVMVNGRPTTQQQRRIRWTAVSGVVQVEFDDVLVPASRSLPEPELDRLEPWDLKACIPYADEYLAGFRAEVYRVGLADGFEDAKERMKPRIIGAIESAIGGDEQRIGSTRTRYDRVTFKHLLLPVWVSAYRFNNTVYRFLVNARTGEVTGGRPYSAIKIALFVLMCLTILAIIALIVQRTR